ncbi:MAG: hypothetical protein FD123_193 [Bacteroidetes bacterium]|nr:MAG: hypothetical protein FD123_193 [Bacteroidota bacterium]
MKKLTLILAGSCFMMSLSAQITYLRDNQLTTSGYHYTVPKDLIVDNTASLAVGVVEMKNSSNYESAAAITKSDLGSGASFSGKMYSSITGHPMTGERVLAVGGNYYMLTTYWSNVNTMALVKVNGTTGAVMFSNNLTNSLSGMSPEVTVVDFAYDGSAYFYIVGHHMVNNQSDLWVAKIDLNGVLQWRKSYASTGTEEEAHNIFFYQNNGIYVGAITAPTATPLWRKGLIMQIDNNGAVIFSKDLAWYSFPSPHTQRMFGFTVKRLQDNVYVVAHTLLGADGPGPLLVAKLSHLLVPVSYTVYDTGSFVYMTPYNGEFLFANNMLVVPGIASPMNAAIPGYVNAFFNLSSSFLNANDVALNTQMFGNIITATDAAHTVFSLADNSNDDYHLYRLKGSPGTATISCDNPYPFYPIGDLLSLNTFPVSVLGLKQQTMVSFICNMSTLSFSETAPCYYDPWAQRLDGSGQGIAAAPEGLSLYPNPASGSLQVQVGGIAGNYRITVMDASGRLVMESEYNSGEKTTLDITALAEGIYVLRVTGDNGQSFTKKFLKH